MLAMTFGQEAGWLSLGVLSAFAASGVILTLFLILEARVAHPLVDLSIFRSRIFSSGLVSSFLCYLSLSPNNVSHALLSRGAAFAPARPGRTFPHRRPYHRLFCRPDKRMALRPLWLPDAVLPGNGSGCGRALFPRQADSKSIGFGHTPAPGSTGLGQGMFLAPNSNAIISSAPENRIGVASGFMATVRVLGQGFSVAISGAIFTLLAALRGRSARQGRLLHPQPLQYTSSMPSTPPC